jgi:signal peptidase I
MGIIIKEQETMMTQIRQLISEGKTVTITAKGYSMNPFIVHLKDQITIGPFNDAQIKAGAVVLAKDSRGVYIIHRIIKREGDVITLRGDGNYLKTIEKARVADVIGLMCSVTKKRRTYSVKSLRWRLYSWFWRLVTPVRRYPLALWRRIHRQEPLR